MSDAASPLPIVQVPTTTATETSKKSKKKRDRGMRYVFTLNNWSPEEYCHLTNPTTVAQLYKWIVIGSEVGEEGTPHLQGAFILLKQTAFSTIKTLPGLERAHLEKMRGLPVDSLIYCTKEDSHAYVYGDLPSQGKRNDIHVVVNEIRRGKRMREICENDDYAVVAVKYFKGLNYVSDQLSSSRDPSTPPQVYWLYGSTGTGKTKCSWEFGVAKYGHDDIYISSCENLVWMDGYDGQRLAIFDDFRSKGVAFSKLLRITDRYPYRAAIKGSMVKWNPETIIFTTPHDIPTTFSERSKFIPEDLAQLQRRV
uniref:hypothetical protein n=1 Tax=Rheinheimera sp. TaxID=1869214 RepID=UPI004047EAC7